MKVVLVWPYGNDITYSFPLGIGYLVSNTTNPEHKLRVFDGALLGANAESLEFTDFLKSFKPEAVMVSCWSKTYKEALRVVCTAKALLPDVVTVMGGIHPTSYPDKTIINQAIDYLLTGECEFTFPEFLDKLAAKEDVSDILGIVFQKGQEIVRNPSHRIEDLDSIKIPDYDAIDLEGYLKKGYRYYSRKSRNAPIWVTRGCPYRCRFCTAPMINGKTLRRHSIPYVIDWIKFLYNKYGIRHINIIDDNFTFFNDYTQKFCRAIIKENLKGLDISTANGIRAQRTNLESLKLMKKAGWYKITVAPESGSPRVLKLMQKDVDVDMWPTKVAEIRKAGLTVHALFLIGYPGETKDDLHLTEEFIRKCDFDVLGIQYFQPLPGTPVYDDLVRQGEITDVLMPNTTTEKRVYVTPELRSFNFARYALKMYLLNFLRRPMGTISEIILIPNALVLRRFIYVSLDAFFNIGALKSEKKN